MQHFTFRRLSEIAHKSISETSVEHFYESTQKEGISNTLSQLSSATVVQWLVIKAVLTGVHS